MRREESKSFDWRDAVVIVGLVLIALCLALVEPLLLIGLAGCVLVKVGV